MNGTIFDIKELGIHDGPGLRTTVFFKGCPLRCVWCHNPEGLSAKPQLLFRENRCRRCGLCQRGCTHPDCQPYGRCLHICPDNLLSVTGETLSASALAKRILKNRTVIGRTGGVTFSGGEPLLQPEFLLETISYLDGVHIAIETSGYADKTVFEKVIGSVDLVYMDLKLADDEAHRRYTGVSNEKIRNNFEILKKSGVPCVIRTPLIPGITDTEENLEALHALTVGMTHEFLPYNAMAGAKYPWLGMEYPFDHLT